MHAGAPTTRCDHRNLRRRAGNCGWSGCNWACDCASCPSNTYETGSNKCGLWGTDRYCCGSPSSCGDSAMLLCCGKLSRVRFAQAIHATMPIVLQRTEIAATALTRRVVPTHLVLAYCRLIGSHLTTVLVQLDSGASCQPQCNWNYQLSG